VEGQNWGVWPWAALATALVLMFWVLGAYNRLVVLRNAVAAAWQQVVRLLDERAGAEAALAAALRRLLPSETAALESLQVAMRQQAEAQQAMSARPLEARRAAQWLVTEAARTAAAQRVLALLEGSSAAQEDAELSSLRALLKAAAEQLPYVRHQFNDAAAAHDAALAEFPTSMLVRWFGFAPAGRV
jgi:LemA protein